MVKVQGKYRKVVGRRSNWIVVVGSREIWTVDLSRGRFRHFVIKENRGESQLALILEIAKGEIAIEQGPSIQWQIWTVDCPGEILDFGDWKEERLELHRNFKNPEIVTHLEELAPGHRAWSHGRRLREEPKPIKPFSTFWDLGVRKAKSREMRSPDL